MMPINDSVGNIVRQIYDLQIEGLPVLDVATNFPSAKNFPGRGRASATRRDWWRSRCIGCRAFTRSCVTSHQSANDMRDWRMFILKAYGAEFPRNMAVCPTLAALVTASRDVLSASISFLAPGKHIPDIATVSRCSVLLPRMSMPLAADDRPAAVLKIAAAEHRLPRHAAKHAASVAPADDIHSPCDGTFAWRR